ncbi:hypothetical protein HZA99_05070 [Candidatus Woesearchaeota archaeon]|nr:hypothetical protein [Candidatus Woesearchaeota archaeon]
MSNYSRWICFIFLLLLITSACSQEKTQLTGKNKHTSKTEAAAERTSSAEKNYIIFTLNDNEWAFPEKSVDALKRVIKIHEKYNVPIDIYFSDATFQNLVSTSPEVLKELNTSSVVAIAYHIRPPMPAYEGYDFLNLISMSEQDRYNTLLNYEQHRLDLETGEAVMTDEGGYQYVKDTIGYSPTTVSVENIGPIAKTMRQVYADLGAKLSVKHSGNSSVQFALGQKDGPLYVRPENAEIKLYDHVYDYGLDEAAAGKVIEDAIVKEGVSGGFINIKMHDNNFYAVMPAPFWDVYAHDKKPPFDLSAAYEHELLTTQEAEDTWAFYENTVAYVSHHPELYTAVNMFDVEEMLGIPRSDVARK